VAGPPALDARARARRVDEVSLEEQDEVHAAFPIGPLRLALQAPRLPASTGVSIAGMVRVRSRCTLGSVPFDIRATVRLR